MPEMESSCASALRQGPLDFRVIGAEAPSDVLGHSPDVLGQASGVVPWQIMNFYLRCQLAPAGCSVRGIEVSQRFCPQ